MDTEKPFHSDVVAAHSWIANKWIDRSLHAAMEHAPPLDAPGNGGPMFGGAVVPAKKATWLVLLCWQVISMALTGTGAFSQLLSDM